MYEDFLKLEYYLMYIFTLILLVRDACEENISAESLSPADVKLLLEVRQIVIIHVDATFSFLLTSQQNPR